MTKCSQIRASKVDVGPTLQTRQWRISPQENIHWMIKAVDPIKNPESHYLEQVDCAMRWPTSHTVLCQPIVGNATPESEQSRPERTNMRKRCACGITRVEYVSSFGILVHYVNDGELTPQKLLATWEELMAVSDYPINHRQTWLRVQQWIRKANVESV